ncbi:secondary carrier transporter [Lithospermum erythrorhizon]|uniref:Copper transport protein n=1 Tax=Lithospermum erythrorhizon TaxID=34254 RepID=A0AAV3RUM4_LITER
MMHMTFYWGIQATILFDSWKTNSWLSYLPSLLALFLVAIFYQFNEQNRLNLKKNPSKSTTITTPLLDSKGSRWSAAKIGGAILFGVNSSIGYLLMLAIMSFNGGVFVAIVLGLAVGYFFFRSDDVGGVVDNPCACA